MPMKQYTASVYTISYKAKLSFCLATLGLYRVGVYKNNFRKNDSV